MTHSYTFTHADTDVVTNHVDMKAFKAWAIANLALLEGVPFVHGTSVNDGTREFGKLRYIKPSDRRPADVAGSPTMVTADADNPLPSLQDVLADIDRLELDDAVEAGVVDTDADLIADMDDDGSDFEDPAPVRLVGTPAEDIDDIVDWQLRNSPARRTQEGGRPASTTVRTRRGTHANCTHATAGDAGKKARAACRKARAAAEASSAQAV